LLYIYDLLFQLYYNNYNYMFEILLFELNLKIFTF
jgi:hypothetical protein